mmetsp:Transcript_15247/g.41988  ORF Transcript_15247/g.41988 Transcript_15247/m.41988 type:complete len:260 (-) Transcript_15247:3030-3809(-)
MGIAGILARQGMWCDTRANALSIIGALNGAEDPALHGLEHVGHPGQRRRGWSVGEAQHRSFLRHEVDEVVQQWHDGVPVGQHVSHREVEKGALLGLCTIGRQQSTKRRLELASLAPKLVLRILQRRRPLQDLDQATAPLCRVASLSGHTDPWPRVAQAPSNESSYQPLRRRQDTPRSRTLVLPHVERRHGLLDRGKEAERVAHLGPESGMSLDKTCDGRPEQRLWQRLAAFDDPGTPGIPHHSPSRVFLGGLVKVPCGT